MGSKIFNENFPRTCEMSLIFYANVFLTCHVTQQAPVLRSHEANLRKFGLCMRIPR